MLSTEPEKLHVGQQAIFSCEIQGGEDTEWMFHWYINNNTAGYKWVPITTIYKNREEIWMHHILEHGNYTCRGESNDAQISKISNVVTVSGESGAASGQNKNIVIVVGQCD